MRDMFLALFIALLGSNAISCPLCARAISPTAMVESSQKGDILVRIEPGRDRQAATASVYHYQQDRGGYTLAHTLILENAILPEQLFVTDDGEYIVTLDEDMLGGSTQNAIVIYDLKNNKRKAFALRDILPSEAIPAPPGKLVKLADGTITPGGKNINERASWKHGVLIWTGGVKLDNQTQRLIAPARRILDFRTAEMTVDIPHMKVRAEVNAPVRQDNAPLEEVCSDALNAEELDACLFRKDLKQELERHANIILRASANNSLHLIRMEPGDNKRRARVLIFTYQPWDKTYKKIWELDLKNPVAPSVLWLSPDAHYLVTLDDLRAIGVSANTVVIYNRLTRSSKTFAAEDFLSPEDIKKLRQTPMCRRWRTIGDRASSTFDEKDNKFYPTDNRMLGPSSPYPQVVVDLTNMSVVLAAPFVPVNSK